MNSPYPRILSIGSDPAVFDSRNRILESVGFEVVPCFRGIGAVNEILASKIDGIVLGDCTETVRIELLREFRRIDPTIPVIVIYPVGERSIDASLADAAMESLEGPQCLVQTVMKLIRKSPHSTRPDSAQAVDSAG